MWAPRTSEARTTRGRAPTAASRRSGSPTRRRSASIVPPTSTTSCAGRGDRQVVQTEHALGERADHRADRHAHHRRRHHPAEPAIICTIGSPVGVVGLRPGAPSEVASSVNSGRYASSVSCAHCPGVTSFGSGNIGVGAHHVVDVQCRDPGQVGVREPYGGIDVVLGVATRSRRASANCRAASQLSGPCPCEGPARCRRTWEGRERVVVGALRPGSGRPYRRC